MTETNHESTSHSQANPASERTGVQTTGILSRKDGRDIALFFTGRQHAGENLGDVLRRRREDLGVPIQMCDALSRNIPKELKVILANCMAHSRRKFVEVTTRFPRECRHVLDLLAKVYKHDATAKQERMSPEERLRYHQEKSGPVMETLRLWLKGQIDEHLVEPNSGLGQAIGYMQNHWEKLTRFLEVAGTPLDNNVVECALKKAIIHRKNSLFYKTENGARVGDIFMSLIYTARLSGIDPFRYLVALQKHKSEVRANPRDWLPWSYEETLARSDSGSEPPEREDC
jgi:transposase